MKVMPPLFQQEERRLCFLEASSFATINELNLLNYQQCTFPTLFMIILMAIIKDQELINVHLDGRSSSTRKLPNKSST